MSMRLISYSKRESIYTVAVQGLIIWTIYAIVENFFSTTLSWLIKPNFDYIPLHLGFVSLSLFVIYPFSGLIIGGLSGLGFSLAAIKSPSIINQTRISVCLVSYFYS